MIFRSSTVHYASSLLIETKSIQLHIPVPLDMKGCICHFTNFALVHGYPKAHIQVRGFFVLPLIVGL